MALLMSSGMHFGGLLGAGGLAIVTAGCAYLQAHQSNAVWHMPVAATAGMESPDEQVPEALPETLPEAPSAKPVASPNPSSLAAEPDILPANGPPTVEIAPEVLPARQPVPPPLPRPVADGPTQPATFIVKFKADDAIDDVIANWRRDKPAAQAIFETWSQDDPVFDGMKLVNCSYSGELILEAPVPAGPRAARQGVDALVQAIRGHSAVAYADPDFTAQPGLSEN